MATISEGINWLNTLKQRHAELIRLRDSNAARTSNNYQGVITTTSPTYDARKLDQRITLLAREIRLCNDSLKRTNASTQMVGFELRDDVLGELEDTSAPTATV